MIKVKKEEDVCQRLTGSRRSRHRSTPCCWGTCCIACCSPRWSASPISPPTLVSEVRSSLAGIVSSLFRWAEPQVLAQLFPTQLLFQLWLIICLDRAVLLSLLKAHDGFFELVWCEVGVHLAHDFGAHMCPCHHVDEVVGGHDEDERKNDCLDECLPVERECMVPSVWSFQEP